jgi:hypothetical protein
MSKHCIGDAFIWALNPNSSDLGKRAAVITVLPLLNAGTEVCV